MYPMLATEELESAPQTIHLALRENLSRGAIPI